MYLQGFIIPVETGNKQAYRDLAAKVAPLFAEFGATRTVECWADDVPDGKVTDMKRAVQAKQGETIVYSWILWPDKATCDAGSEKMMADDRMKPDGAPMPFDGTRMIFGGFESVLDTGDSGTFGYIDGFVGAVPDGKRQAYVDHATKMAALFTEKGALRVIDAWGMDVPDGKVTDFKRAVQARDGETMVFGWIEWPDKATRDAAWGALMADPRMRESAPPWNGPTAIFGAFVPILDTATMADA